MGLFMVNQVAFKTECHALIDAANSKEAKAELQSHIKGLVVRHGLAITASQFATQVARLVWANNQGRAHKLVNVVEDVDLTRTGVFALLATRGLVKLGALAGFIVFVVWLCGGLS